MLLALGTAGSIGDLLLLEHYEDTPQFIPLALLSLTLISISWQWWESSKRSLRAFQAVMLLLVAAGPVGMFLHLKGNHEMEREFNPEVLGVDLWTAVVRGEAPALAPGTLVMFGLLGLLYAHRHPSLTANGA